MELHINIAQLGLSVAHTCHESKSLRKPMREDGYEEYLAEKTVKILKREGQHDCAHRRDEDGVCQQCKQYYCTRCYDHVGEEIGQRGSCFKCMTNSDSSKEAILKGSDYIAASGAAAAASCTAAAAT